MSWALCTSPDSAGLIYHSSSFWFFVTTRAGLAGLLSRRSSVPVIFIIGPHFLPYRGCIVLVLPFIMNWHFALCGHQSVKQATQGKGIKWTDEKKFSDLDFANDIVALARSTQDLLVDDINCYAGNIGLVISAKKNKNMQQVNIQYQQMFYGPQES